MTLPPSREERIHDRVIAWMATSCLFGGIAALLVLLVANALLPTAVPMNRTDLAAGLVLGLCMVFTPVGLLVYPGVLRDNGIAAQRYVVALGLVMVRDRDGWRFCWSRRASTMNILPTYGTVAKFVAAETTMFWSMIVCIALRGMLGFTGVAVLGGLLGINMHLLTLHLMYATMIAGVACVMTMLVLIDWFLTRGSTERPAMRAQRQAVYAVQAAMSEGTRPAALVDAHLPALLAPDRQGIPMLAHTAMLRTCAHLHAAQCLIDCERYDEARRILHTALQAAHRLSKAIHPELHYALAYLHARRGDDLSEARAHYQRSNPGGCEGYERHAFEALIAYHSASPLEALHHAETALNCMDNPLYRGMARSVEPVMRDIVTRLTDPTRRPLAG